MWSLRRLVCLSVLYPWLGLAAAPVLAERGQRPAREWLLVERGEAGRRDDNENRDAPGAARRAFIPANARQDEPGEGTRRERLSPEDRRQLRHDVREAGQDYHHPQRRGDSRRR